VTPREDTERPDETGSGMRGSAGGEPGFVESLTLSERLVPQRSIAGSDAALQQLQCLVGWLDL
jgi:hypothetical protein